LPALIESVLALSSRWRLAHLRERVGQTLALAQDCERLADAELTERSLSLRYRAKCGEPLNRLLPQAFALVREASRRTLGLVHFDVQILGGAALHAGTIVEMQTGEGKTLTATLPLFLHALSGRGAHLATANDYLAARDADWMRPIYAALGLSVAAVLAASTVAERRAAYGCDVTYGTAKEFGFDFLRDRLRLRDRAAFRGGSLAVPADGANGSRELETVQRKLHYALVDEADSLLIDEARIPLVISAGADNEFETERSAFRWSAQAVTQFAEKTHFLRDEAQKRTELTAEGRHLVRVLSKPAQLDSWRLPVLYEFIERAIRADRELVRDRQYVVRDGRVVIVDEFTGRMAEGRQWRDGLHQAVEAKEGLDISVRRGLAAQITVQRFFSLYRNLAGMTGTAVSSAREFRKVYGLPVANIPTNRPCLRTQWPDRILPDAARKWAAVVAEVRELVALGRPVLVGARSIDKSERLSELLKHAGILHSVLHARRLADEAVVVARAGERGRVTVATNMAGRGTDIRLGRGVAELGGLHVVGTELHESARIDRQLFGRCARQGDPGSYRQFVALDDEIPERRTQRQVERRYLADRRILMKLAERRQRLHERLGQDPYLDAVDEGLS